MLQHTPEPHSNSLEMEAGGSSETSKHILLGASIQKTPILGTPAMITYYVYSFCSNLSLSEINKISLEVVYRQIFNTLD
jgi:hypothetical protein